jgi:hypothetical protein
MSEGGIYGLDNIKLDYTMVSNLQFDVPKRLLFRFAQVKVLQFLI